YAVDLVEEVVCEPTRRLHEARAIHERLEIAVYRDRQVPTRRLGPTLRGLVHELPGLLAVRPASRPADTPAPGPPRAAVLPRQNPAADPARRGPADAWSVPSASRQLIWNEPRW